MTHGLKNVDLYDSEQWKSLFTARETYKQKQKKSIISHSVHSHGPLLLPASEEHLILSVE